MINMLHTRLARIVLYTWLQTSSVTGYATVKRETALQAQEHKDRNSKAEAEQGAEAAEGGQAAEAWPKPQR